MARTLQIRKPTARDRQRLELMLEDESWAPGQRRAYAILYHGLGLNGESIAHALQVHPNTIYTDLKAFAREGLGCVHRVSPGGAPSQITAQQREAIWHWADCSPCEFGLLDGRWTLESFRTFLIKRQRILKRVSLEHLRRILKKRTFAFGASNANCTAPIHSTRRF